ncbi:monocarboxylate transporter 13 [Exaiptasia diaphana]|uniref:Major facilitator superfamily (MFS) profile domain-containing protein n=1 Tax=Exaiptasia diaphana TaxID=2652724 RepID=A0A913Y8R7_EXADI|nr:monocarboxylate transporter 13 [Exaiptasia diaphana]
MNQLDGITSWIVCLCVVMTNSILFGTMFIYGIFFPFLLKEFQESKSRTALVASLSMGVHTLIGPISSKICLTLGFRNAMILAGLVSASGLLGSSFAPNLYILYLGYGLALGFSVSVVYVGAFQIIPLYFDRHRFLATGVLAVGPGAGPLIMSTIVQAILDHIDWRKTMMVLAGMQLLPCLLGCTISRRNERIKNERIVGQAASLLTKERLCKCLSLLDFTLLRDPLFMMISISFAISILGNYTPYFHLAQYAAELGIPGESSSWMYFSIGTGSMVFRILTGKLLDTGLIPPLRLYQLAMIVFTIAHFLVPLTKNFVLLVVYSSVNGICDGIFVTAALCMILKAYPGMGLGWALCFQGFSFLICPVLAGFISDVSGSYHPVFFTAAGIQLLSICLIQTTQWIKRNTRTQEELKILEQEDLIIVERETVI